MDLLECRREIDNIDEELVKLFEKRMNIAINVARYKIENNTLFLCELLHKKGVFVTFSEMRGEIQI